MRAQHQQNRQAFVERLTQPSVDRVTLEQIRRAELALAGMPGPGRFPSWPRAY